MNDLILNSIIKKYGLSSDKLKADNKQINYQDFDKVIQLTNSIIIVKEVVVFGQTDDTKLTSGKFVQIDSPGNVIDLTNSAIIKTYDRQSDSLIRTQLVSNFLFDAHTRIKFSLDDTLFSSVFWAYVNYLEIYK